MPRYYGTFLSRIYAAASSLYLIAFVPLLVDALGESHLFPVFLSMTPHFYVLGMEFSKQFWFLAEALVFVLLIYRFLSRFYEYLNESRVGDIQRLFLRFALLILLVHVLLYFGFGLVVNTLSLSRYFIELMFIAVILIGVYLILFKSLSRLPCLRDRQKETDVSCPYYSSFWSAPHPILSLNTEFQIVESNESFTQHYGFTLEEISQISLSDFFENHELKREQVLPSLVNNGLWKGEVSFLGKDGKAHQVFMQIKGGGHRFQKLPEYMVHMIDRSFVLELQQKLLASERLSNIGQLASGVAHEINNPLSVIRSNVEYLLAMSPRWEMKEEQRGDLLECLRDMDTYVEHAATVISRMLDFSRDNERLGIQLGAHSTKQVAMDGLDLFPKSNLMGIEIVKEFPEEEIVVQCDLAYALRVIFNIVNNAIQAMEGKGKIFLETGRTEREGWIRIRDTGPGVRPEDRPYVFDPFYTTKPPGEGTGLGLSLCQNFMDQMGGRIELEESEQGASFRLEFPLTIDD